MFNAGIRGKRAKDGTGLLSTAEQFIQQNFLVPTVTSFQVTDGSYVPTDDLAVDTAGGQTIVINGSGFAPGATVQVGATTISVVTFVDSNRLSFTAPALSSGSYTIYVTNSNGGTGILVPGLVYSGLPTFSTSAGSLASLYETSNVNTSVTATGDAPITYSLYSGTLPDGVTLNSNGTLTGTSPVDGSSTTYTFTIKASDAQLQDSTRSFSLTINTDVVTWISPSANGTVYTAYEYTPFSNITMSASSAAGYSANNFSANTLPTGLTLSGNTISGTVNTVGNTNTRLTATSSTTNRTAVRDVVFNVAPDVVTWSTPAADTSYPINGGSAISNVSLSATSAAGRTITYSANSLPSGLSLSGNTIYGTPDTQQTVYTALTATADTTNRTAVRYISWTVNLGDSNWKNVSLLLNGQTSSNTFINDISLNNNSLTVVGNTKPSLFSPYKEGYYSNYFDGTGDYLTLPNSSSFAFGTGDFTIEYWINTTDTGGGLVGQAATGGWATTIYNSTVYWQNAYNASNLWTYSAASIIDGRWHHLAFSRVSGSSKFFIDGVLVATNADSTNYAATTGNIQIGRDANPADLIGYISNLRIIKGTGLYTASFTPSTTPLTTTSQGVTASQVSLLTCQSNRLIDNSVNNFTITKNGDTKVVSAHPFTTPTTAAYNTLYSTYFDGSGDYLTIADNANFEIGLNVDYTIEAWFNVSSYPGAGGYANIITKGASGIYQPFYLFINPSGSLLYYSSSTGSSWNIASAVSFGTISVNTWYHVAISRQGTNTRLFLNGALINTIASSGAALYDNTRAVAIGGRSDGTETQLVGTISNVRFVKGTAIYTAEFTPPTTSLTAVANTVLLTCQNSTFIDNSTNAFTITSNGDAKPIAVSPFTMTTSNTTVTSLGSAYFDGTGDYLTTPTSAGFGFGTGTFTFESWVYPTSNPTNGPGTVIDCRTGTNAEGWVVRVFNNLTIGIYDGPNDVYVYSTSTVVMNAWNHIAIVRSSTSSGGVAFYINGVLSNTGTIASNLGSTWVARIGSNYASGYDFNGYISNLRIIKGTALYTANFLPPQTTLTPVTNTQLLTCQYNGGATNNGFVDQSTFNNVMSVTGNATQGTFSPYSQNGWSNYFDGTGDFLTVPYSAQLAEWYNTDYTMEAWIYTGNWAVSVNNSSPIAISHGIVNNTTLYWSFGWNSSGYLGFYYYNGGAANLTSNTIVSQNTWHHIAFTHTNATGTISLYLDGVLVASGAKSGTPQSNSGSTIQIGHAQSTSFNGYISNVRITKGALVYTSAFTPSTTPLSAVSGTQLLTCQSNRLIDNSPNNFTITRNGDVSVQAYSPFGGVTSVPTSYSVYLDGTGDYLKTPSTGQFAASGDYTVEAWVYFRAQGSPCLINNYTNNTQDEFDIEFAVNGAGLSTSVYLDGLTSIKISGSIVIPLNTWTHLALVRSGSTNTLYINGVADGTYTYSGPVGSATKSYDIGRYSTGQYLNGFVSNLRLVDGTAIYTGNFTPPTTPLTAVSGTSLLTCQSDRMIDNSTNYFAITAYGDTKSSPFNPFGTTTTTGVSYSPSVNGGSMYFDGTGDQVTAASSNLFAFGSNDFTLEGWIYVASGTSGTLIDFRTGASTIHPVLFNNSGTLILYVGGAGRITGSALRVGEWTHVALVRISGVTKLYQNGVQVGSSYTDANVYLTGPAYVGAGLSLANALNGYISDVRVTNGKGFYTSNFVPPVAPLTPSYTIGANTYSSNLLLTGTSGGIVDAHGTNNLETVGNTQLAPEDPYAGSYYSNNFDGSSGFITFPNDANFAFGTGAFTIEFWINAPSNNDKFILTGRLSIGTMHITTGGYGGTTVGALRYVGASTIATTTSITDGTWHHCAIVRDGNNNITLYVDGVSIATGTDSTNYTSTSGTWYLARNDTTAANYLTGNISNIRIIKNQALFTGSFTPSTAPLTTTAVGHTGAGAAESITGTVAFLSCQSNKFVDNSASALTLTVNGTSRVKSINPFQQNTGKSLYFDGTGDYLVTQNSPNVNPGSGSFTIEFWLYYNSITGYITPFSKGYTAANELLFQTGNGNGTLLVYISGTAVITESSAATAGQWYHYALVRNGTALTLYRNGVSVGTATNSVDINNTYQLAVGAAGKAPGGGAIGDFPLNGYIKDLRITKGVARYTTTFTPPTTTFEVR